MPSISSEELQEVMNQIQKLLEKIADFKNKEEHLERLRLLKMVDAELIDALYNLNQMVGIGGKTMA